MNQSAIQLFVGSYVYLRDTALNITPGDILLVCTRRRGGPEVVHLLIFVNDDVWYEAHESPVTRAQGWHMLLRGPARSWTILSRRQRIFRACSEAMTSLAHEIHLATSGGSDAPVTTINALEHFTEIRNQVIVTTAQHSYEEMRIALDDWLTSTAVASGRTRVDLVNSLLSADERQMLSPDTAIATPLAEAIADLAYVLGHAGVLDDPRAADSELEDVQAACDHVSRLLDEERCARNLLMAAFTTLGMKPVTAFSAARDAMLRRILETRDYAASTRYMLSNYMDGTTFTAEQVQQAMESATQISAPVVLPGTENRQTRNIRLGRRRDA